MEKKRIVMTLSENGYKGFRLMMRKLGFSNEDLFMRYCAITVLKQNLKKINPKATPKEKKMIDKELKMISDHGKRWVDV
jgi:hypothetical protein